MVKWPRLRAESYQPLPMSILPAQRNVHMVIVSGNLHGLRLSRAEISAFSLLPSSKVPSRSKYAAVSLLDTDLREVDCSRTLALNLLSYNSPVKRLNFKSGLVLGHHVYSAPCSMVAVVVDALTVPGDEDAHLAWCQAMVSHLSVDGQPRYNLLCRAWFVGLDVILYLLSQPSVSSSLLATFS